MTTSVERKRKCIRPHGWHRHLRSMRKRQKWRGGRNVGNGKRRAMTTTDNLITELQQRCPGCTFTVESNPPKIRIVEYERKFIVDLTELGETAEQWFRTEIARHPAGAALLQPDEKYRVICSWCGPVVLGYGRYRDQLAKPDTGWYCPTCGGFAKFDSETYENYLTGEQR